MFDFSIKSYLKARMEAVTELNRRLILGDPQAIQYMNDFWTTQLYITWLSAVGIVIPYDEWSDRVDKE